MTRLTDAEFYCLNHNMGRLSIFAGIWVNLSISPLGYNIVILAAVLP